MNEAGSADHEVVGEVLAVTDDGEIDIRDDDGVVRYCWPYLRLEDVGPLIKEQELP